MNSRRAKVIIGLMAVVIAGLVFGAILTKYYNDQEKDQEAIDAAAMQVGALTEGLEEANSRLTELGQTTIPVEDVIDNPPNLVPIPGPQGDKGDKGDKGDPGEDGLTPPCFFELTQCDSPDPNDPDFNDPETQDPEEQEPEFQDTEVDDPDPNDPDPDDPELQEEEIQEAEIQDPEEQEAEIQEGEIDDPDPESNVCLAAGGIWVPVQIQGEDYLLCALPIVTEQRR